MYYFINFFIHLKFSFFFIYFIWHKSHATEALCAKLTHQRKRDRNSPACAMWRTATTVKATQIFIFSTVGLVQGLKASPATQNTKITQLLHLQLKLKRVISVPQNVIAKIIIVFIFQPLVIQTDVQSELFTCLRQINLSQCILSCNPLSKIPLNMLDLFWARMTPWPNMPLSVCEVAIETGQRFCQFARIWTCRTPVLHSFETC